MKQEILNEATEMFLEYGFKSVTMDDIAEKLGISKKTIYTNYSTKTKLVEDVAFNIVEQIENAIYDIKKKDLNAIEEFFEIKKKVSLFLKDEKSSPQFQLQKYYPKIFEKVECNRSEMISGSIESNLSRGISENLFRKNINKDFVCRIHQEGLNTIRNTSVFPADLYQKKDVFQLYIEYHIRGIATEKGLKILEDLLNKNEAENH